MKTLLKLSFLSIIATTALLSAPQKADNGRKYYEKGWWWYEEKVVDQETGKEEVVKTKMSPEEKKKMDDNDDIKKLLQANLEVNKKILERLEYAFPNTTPKYSINSKGEKCLSNSSADCFVMPVIAEGQHVPVLANFLKEPNEKNSIEYLKWQGVYFNHVKRVGNGLRFAYLNGGSDVYPTDTIDAMGDTYPLTSVEGNRALREAEVLYSLRNKVGYMIFIGKTPSLEKGNTIFEKFSNFGNSFIKDMDVAIILPNQKALNYLNKEIDKLKKLDSGEKKAAEYLSRVKKLISPELYKKYNVKMTPNIFIVYQADKNSKIIHQNLLGVNGLSVPDIRTRSINFLMYNKIIEPKILAEENSLNSFGDAETIKYNDNYILDLENNINSSEEN